MAANPGILGEDLLIVGKEFSGFDRTNERLDLLAVDEDDASPWRANVYFATDIGELRNRLRENPDVLSSVSVEGKALNESFASEIAARLTTMIESITPIVNEFEDENNEEQA